MATEQQNRKIASNVTLNKGRFLLVGNPQWLSTKFVFIYQVFNSGKLFYRNMTMCKRNKECDGEKLKFSRVQHMSRRETLPDNCPRETLPDNCHGERDTT